jgi:L-fuconolactonase
LIIIDAHQHFWRLGQNDCSWPPPELRVIHRDFEPKDLLPLAAAASVTGTVLVQSQPSERDTDYLLALADRTPLVKAVVGWTDLLAPDAPARIAALAAHPKMRGLRPMLQSLPADWILNPALDPAIEAMMQHGLRFDALVVPRQLSALHNFARRYPSLKIIIDHGAKPLIRQGALDPWRDGIAALAALPQVHCKFSGLVTEANSDWQPEDLQSYVDHLLACFGPARLMWGSDWPVVNLACDYSRWLSVARKLSRLSNEDDVSNLFRRTAERVYDIQ